MAGSSGRGGGGGVLVPPRIIDDPTNVTVLRNEPATLRCAFDGIPPPEVTWYREGEALEPRGHRLVLPDGALFFLRVTQSRGGGRSGNGGGDAGTYWCVARNAAGQARSRNATLTVACKSSLLFSVISFYECLICRWHGPIFPPPSLFLVPWLLHTLTLPASIYDSNRIQRRLIYYANIRGALSTSFITLRPLLRCLDLAFETTPHTQGTSSSGPPNLPLSRDTTYWEQ